MANGFRAGRGITDKLSTEDMIAFASEPRENKLPQFIDGSIIEITAADLEGVTAIRNNAFAWCTGLTSVTIPDSITSIGHSAFTACNELKNVYIDDIASWCNMSFAEATGNPINYAKGFYIKNALGEYEFVTNLVIPDSVMSIAYCAFYNCSSLTSVTIPDSVTSIGYSAFSSCTGLTSITIPDSVTSIDDYAFSSCTGLTSVTMGNSVTSISYSAFNSCSNLTNFTTASPITGTLDFKQSRKLTIDSLKNIINALVDYSGTTYEGTYKLILNSTCNATLEAEGATAPNGLTWQEYALVKGWIIN